MNLNLLFSLLVVLSLAPNSSGFSLVSLVQKGRSAGMRETALQTQSKEEQDWLAEMENQSYEALQREKEPLFDHDDWANYRSPNRRTNDTFDFMWPGVALFVVWLLVEAILM